MNSAEGLHFSALVGTVLTYWAAFVTCTRRVCGVDVGTLLLDTPYVLHLYVLYEFYPLFSMNIPHTPKIVHLLTLIQTMHHICDSSMPLYRQRMSLYCNNIFVLLVHLTPCIDLSQPF